MRLLLDSHILLAIVRDSVSDFGPEIALMVRSRDHELFASAASLWEIAIKVRLGKLDAGMHLGDLPGYYLSAGMNLLAVDHRHAVSALATQPATRDPFDRMLLAQCEVEGLQLITVDRVLAAHPLAWRPG